MSAPTRVPLATLKSRSCNLPNENVLVGQRGASQGLVSRRAAAQKVHEDRDNFVANLRALVGGKDAAEDWYHVSDA